MASFRCYPVRWLQQQAATPTANGYFMITLTNYPRFLARSEQYHTPPRDELPVILEPNTLVHFGAMDSNTRELLLYNTVKYEFEQALRSYLEQTERLYPLSMIFDMRDMVLRR